MEQAKIKIVVKNEARANETQKDEIKDDIPL